MYTFNNHARVHDFTTFYSSTLYTRIYYKFYDTTNEFNRIVVKIHDILNQ